MNKVKSNKLGSDNILKLIISQSIPAAIGILMISLYMIIDTIFIGRWVGSIGIAAVTVVMPISFLVSSFGLAIGVGGSSIISRALGADNKWKAHLTFGNQIMITAIVSSFILGLGYFFIDELLTLFGANGEIIEPAREYFKILLPAAPFLAWIMMANTNMRAEGNAKAAMFAYILPAILNIILDIIFIYYLGMGISGAAWATALSYFSTAIFSLGFYVFDFSEIGFKKGIFSFNFEIVKEISSLGGVTMARQGSMSLLAIIINNALYNYGGELGIASYGIISRIIMLAMFPIMGITQGFIPIAGYNFGARMYDRVNEAIKKSIFIGTLSIFFIYLFVILFPEVTVRLFTQENSLIQMTSKALILVFIAAPTFGVQLIASAYFQAIGRVYPALFLTLSRQVIFLIPLILLLSPLFGLNGIWYSFPIADSISAFTSFILLKSDIKRNLKQRS